MLLSFQCQGVRPRGAVEGCLSRARRPTQPVTKVQSRQVSIYSRIRWESVQYTYTTVLSIRLSTLYSRSRLHLQSAARKIRGKLSAVAGAVGTGSERPTRVRMRGCT